MIRLRWLLAAAILVLLTPSTGTAQIRLAGENGEDWSSLPLERQDHYFDRAKETA